MFKSLSALVMGSLMAMSAESLHLEAPKHDLTMQHDQDKNKERRFQKWKKTWEDVWENYDNKSRIIWDTCWGACFGIPPFQTSGPF
jgi:hypothetical protein